MPSGVYLEKQTVVLEYEMAFLSASIEYPEMPGIPADRKMRAVRQFPYLADRPLHECAQDVVDEALSSGSEQKLFAALDYVQLKQRYLLFLLDCPVGLKYELALDVKVHMYWQQRINAALDGTTPKWLN